MRLLNVFLTLLLGTASTLADHFSPSEPPRPIYMAPPSTSEHPGALYLAALVNQLSTERYNKYRIEGPTPVPETHHNSPSTQYTPGSFMGALESFYNEASENYLQKPPESSTYSSSYPSNNKYPVPSEDNNLYYWHQPGEDESSTNMADDMDSEMGHVKGNEVAVTANPLFAAMASFIGLSTLFAASVILFPKFGGRSLQAGPEEEEERDWAKQIIRTLEKMQDKKKQ
ncbi:uncharacterized protein LOC132204262 [Neocloeon triangulifer]|uniref:uncharacterized protein LOC132204262 n=1 Tax=Neocloeon triangulifer TaxID=2078957 RepID=UPI00286F0B9A|nr:uncharacterized protein LOC132204262 [Neocloeon triangulifer]